MQVVVAVAFLAQLPLLERVALAVAVMVETETPALLA
jgi:hypothetical protein